MKKMNLNHLQSELFETSCKLRGLAELLMLYECEPALDEGEVWYGVGLLLRELGEDLRSHSRDIDEHQVRKAQRKIRSERSEAGGDHE